MRSSTPTRYHLEEITKNSLFSSPRIMISAQKATRGCLPLFFRRIGSSGRWMKATSMITKPWQVSNIRISLTLQLEGSCSKNGLHHYWRSKFESHIQPRISTSQVSPIFTFVVVRATYFFWIGRLWLWHRIGFSPRLFVCGTLWKNYLPAAFSSISPRLSSTVTSLFSRGPFSFFSEVSGLPTGYQHITNCCSDLTIHGNSRRLGSRPCQWFARITVLAARQEAQNDGREWWRSRVASNRTKCGRIIGVV